jgi:pimeloyl-ACP methyl ester carboxylesterase
VDRGVDYARYADQIVGARCARFDIVGFDPRGVGQSAPLDCLSDADLDTFLGMDPTPDDKAEEEAFVAGARKLADGLRGARRGNLLAHVSTVEAARDMDILRAALGEPKLHYLGKSYGTFLGSTYADLFPLNVGRFVLDGVVPPDLTSAEVSEGQARGFELATKAYLASCIAKGNCPIGNTVEEGMQWIKDFLLKLDSDPLPVSGDARVTKLTEAWGSMGLAYAMYSKSSWSSLTAALRSAQQGDGTDLMDLAGQYADRTSSGTYTGNIMEVIYAVNCLDRPDTADLTLVEKNAETFSASAPRGERCSPGVRCRVASGPCQPPARPRRSRQPAAVRSSSSAPPATRPRSTSGRSGCARNSPTRCSSPSTATDTRHTRARTRASTGPSTTTTSTGPCRRTASSASRLSAGHRASAAGFAVGEGYPYTRQPCPPAGRTPP